MKLLIASDIHGSAYWCRKMTEAFETEAADRMLLLGDILYHGPRNDLPQEYSPKAVIEMLSAIKDKLLCVRGNCEAEVDQMVLPFPIMAEYAVIFSEGRAIYATHGHKCGEEMNFLGNGDILLCGHTHVPECTDHGKYIYMNPGSVSIPKSSSPHSYMIVDGGRFSWKDLESKKTYMEF